MEIIFVLIGISFLIAVSFVGAFIWASKQSQFSNIELEKWKILNKEEKSEEKVWKES